MDNNTNCLNVVKFQYIIDCLPAEELLCQLAEEVSELAQAALKLRRCLDGTNPSRVPKEDAWKQLFEEIADVWCRVHQILPLTNSLTAFRS